MSCVGGPAIFLKFIFYGIQKTKRAGIICSLLPYISKKCFSGPNAMQATETWATTVPGSPKIETGSSFSKHNKTC